MGRIFKIIQVIAWFLFAVMLASLIIIPLYFVMLIYLLADWDSLSGPLLVSWTSINFLGLVIFFYLLLRWVNQRLVAATLRRTHSAKGR